MRWLDSWSAWQGRPGVGTACARLETMRMGVRRRKWAMRLASLVHALVGLVAYAGPDGLCWVFAGLVGQVWLVLSQKRERA